MNTSGEAQVEAGLNTGMVADRFAQSKTGEIKFQSVEEIYSVLRELENYTGDHRETLIGYIDEFAVEIPVERKNTQWELNWLKNSAICSFKAWRRSFRGCSGAGEDLSRGSA